MPLCRPNGPSHGMSVTPDEAPDDRDVAAVRVAERRDAARRRGGRRIARAAWRPPWMPPWATPGTGRSGFHGCTAASPTAKISGWPGHRQVGLDEDPAGSIGGAPRRPSRPRRRTTPARMPGRPEHGPRRDRLPRPAGDLDRDASDRRGRRPACPVRTIAAEPLELALRRARTDPAGTVGRIRSIASTSRIRAAAVSIERKSRRSVSRAISPSAPASSTPVGPPPTSDERHPLGAAAPGRARARPPRTR